MIAEEKSRSRISKILGSRRFQLLVGGLGLGAALVYRFLRAGKDRLPKNIVDDRGTGQRKASQLLRSLRDRAFEKSDEKLALALGRSEKQVHAWCVGEELIDDDAFMKARGIALHRGLNIG
jgi:hypothetical protein